MTNPTGLSPFSTSDTDLAPDSASFDITAWTNFLPNTPHASGPASSGIRAQKNFHLDTPRAFGPVSSGIRARKNFLPDTPHASEPASSRATIFCNYLPVSEILRGSEEVIVLMNLLQAMEEAYLVKEVSVVIAALAVVVELVVLSTLPRLHFRDHIWTYSQRYLAAEAIEEAAAAMKKAEEGATEDDRNADGMSLVQLLVACAEAVACRDKFHALALLSELQSNALAFSSSFQRVASCLVQGLSDKLSQIQPPGTVGFAAPMMNLMDIASDKKEEALHLVYEICPCIQFGHFVANLIILEAFEGESFVHVVDLGMTLCLPQGHQWHWLIQSLANRTGKPPCRLRIIAVGFCVDKFHVIGNELEEYAKDMGISLQFSVAPSNLENLKPSDIKVSEDEVLTVNSILQLHSMIKESREALNSILQIIHELAPKILVLVEQDSSHNGPFFLGRFMESLHYYSAIFDSLHVVLPKYDTRRAKIEQSYFTEEIKNIINCEGLARVERHERVDQSRRRMSCAGFQAASIKIMAQAKQWLGKNNACEGYTVVEEKGCLVLGWKSKPIVAASCWKC